MKELYNLIENKIGIDKVAHFLGIALIAVAMALVFAKTTPDLVSWCYGAMGAVAGAVVAVLKEVFDFFNNRKFDTKDILAGIAGCVVALVVVGIFL
jgi:VanZ family protein